MKSYTPFTKLNRLPAHYFSGIGMLALTSLLVLPAFTQATTLTRSLDLASNGSDVTVLQTYLATDTSLYPSRLVTGYYGQLTKAAIERFQTRYGIVSQGTPDTTGYGRVGPITLAALNARMGGTVPPASIVRSVFNVRVTTDTDSATITWNSINSARGKVHYQTSFPTMTEASAVSPALISGTVVTAGTYSNAHSITLNDLDRNTTYYYVVESVNLDGHQDIIWPNTFRTQ